MGLRGIVFAAVIGLILRAPAGAQTVSPGPLSSVHAGLEGIKNCTQCHELGRREISAPRCLACHTSLRARIDGKRGFHVSADVAGAPCESCHHEHAGRDLPLVDWGGPRESFDHARTGYTLDGAHRRASCEACHDARRIHDPALVERLARTPAAHTYLGLETDCLACHADEHRGQLSRECGGCHDTGAWKPAPRFDHERSAYPLRGAHARIDCERCHAEKADPAYSATAFPAARSARYRQFHPVAHGACSDCHRDPHDGRLGSACADCHTETSWAAVGKGTARGGFDHDRTRYPLQGRHRQVACDKCHPTGAGGKGALSGIAFAHCADCHADAHSGQIAATGGAIDCEPCHTVDGFAPARYTLDDHARSRYPLEGAHRAVPCAACHPKDATLRPAEGTPKRLSMKRDATRLAYGDRVLTDCATCHADPHQGQFAQSVAGRAARACAECHGTASFREPAFDHARDAGFPLRGRHAAISCAACHPGSPPKYRGAARECAACHEDPHLGQFAGERGSCERCHSEEHFRPADRFEHADTRFGLTGAHQRAKCEACHRTVQVLPDRAASLYRPLPGSCDGCHADPHAGAYREGPGGTTCESCHLAETWAALIFDHDRTRFPLGAAHGGVGCGECHAAGTRALPPLECAKCHADPHDGFLGSRCESCHSGPDFHETDALAAHERTGFPLLGRHASVPCASCHADRAEASFVHVDPACRSCHEADYQRTAGGAVDHAAWGFSRTCEQCHDSFRWDRATYREHEKCFPIRSGRHSNIACLECHTSLSVQPVGDCATMTAACTRCHSCEHPSVPGFECASAKCWACHPNGAGGD